MKDKPLVILASARKQGDTNGFLHQVFAAIDYNLIDLLDYHLSPYNYSGEYTDKDDFLNVVDEMLRHNIIVFATPVYWYAMSGRMKTLFDRLTDIVTTKKHLGRKLQAKTTLLLAVGTDPELPKGFELPFQLTSEYFNMNYQGCIYHSTKYPIAEENILKAKKAFTDKLKKHHR